MPPPYHSRWSDHETVDRLQFKTGDFVMVPSGVPHQFVDLKAPVRVMSMYLPNAK
jgi:uncharacterized RmlC-like cupin family protein